MIVLFLLLQDESAIRVLVCARNKVQKKSGYFFGREVKVLGAGNLVWTPAFYLPIMSWAYRPSTFWMVSCPCGSHIRLSSPSWHCALFYTPHRAGTEAVYVLQIGTCPLCCRQAAGIRVGINSTLWILIMASRERPASQQELPGQLIMNHSLLICSKLPSLLFHP